MADQDEAVVTPEVAESVSPDAESDHSGSAQSIEAAVNEHALYRYAIRIEQQETPYRRCAVCEEPVPAGFYITITVGCSSWPLHRQCFARLVNEFNRAAARLFGERRY